MDRDTRGDLDEIYLRTGKNGARFRDNFIIELKKLGNKRTFLRITEECGIISELMNNWRRINEKRCSELRNWYFELKVILKNKRLVSKAMKNGYSLSRYMCHNCGTDLPISKVDLKKIIYCSEECRKVGPRDRKRKWREKNPEAHFKSQKKYYSSL